MGKKLPNETTEELRGMSWKEYISSRYWRKFSKKVLDDENVTCELCNVRRWNGVYVRGKKKGKRRRLRQFQCHHLNYKHLGEESLEDIMVLCAKCHETAHSLETLSSSRGGVWEQLYISFTEITKWEYTSFNEKENKK